MICETRAANTLLLSFRLINGVVSSRTDGASHAANALARSLGYQHGAAKMIVTFIAAR